MMNLFEAKDAPLIDRVPYWGFVLPDVVMTKHGQLLFFARVGTAGVDGRSSDQLDRVTQSWQKLLGSVEAPHRAFLIFQRPEQPVPDDFDNRDDIAGLAQRKRLAYVCSRVRRMQTYLCIAFDPQLSKAFRKDQRHWLADLLRNWLVDRHRSDHLTVYVRELIDQAVATCRSRYQAITSLVQDLTPLHPVEGNEVAALLYRVINQGEGTWEPLRTLMPYGLCWRLTGPDVSFQRSHMLVGDAVVGLYSGSSASGLCRERARRALQDLGSGEWSARVPAVQDRGHLWRGRCLVPMMRWVPRTMAAVAPGQPLRPFARPVQNASGPLATASVECTGHSGRWVLPLDRRGSYSLRLRPRLPLSTSALDTCSWRGVERSTRRVPWSRTCCGLRSAVAAEGPPEPLLGEHLGAGAHRWAARSVGRGYHGQRCRARASGNASDQAFLGQS